MSEDEIRDSAAYRSGVAQADHARAVAIAELTDVVADLEATDPLSPTLPAARHALERLGGTPPPPSSSRPAPPAARAHALAAAAARRDAGMARADENAPDDWRAEAEAFLEDYLRRHPFMHADDLWTAGLRRPPEARAIGPVLARAARAGLMEKTGEHRPSAASNLAPRPVWRSLIYRPDTVDAEPLTLFA